MQGAIVAALTRVTSASKNEITDWCSLTRVGNTTSEVNTARSVSTFAGSAGAGGAVVIFDAGLACGHEQAQWLESSDAVQR